MKSIASLAALVGITFWQLASAWAYCRTTTCDREDAPVECVSSRVNDCSTMGAPITWPSTCVSSSVSVYGSPYRGISPDTMRGIVANAFQQWTTAGCRGGGNPNFIVDMFPDVVCQDATGDSGYKSTGPNYNLWIFHDDSWPYDDTGGESAIATTKVQFDKFTGEIFDADVELNSYGNVFTTDPNDVKVDLLSVVQHESGHFLGLGHSQDPDATMYFSLDPATGETTKRVLKTDDIDGICSVYPPGKLDPECDPEPRHGFSTDCQLPPTGCAVAFGRGIQRKSSFGGLTLGLVLAIGAARRRRSRDKYPTPRSRLANGAIGHLVIRFQSSFGGFR